MRILMLAPEPFFQPRGTPFSEYYRVQAMTELGHDVDLVTYPIGEDVAMPGLKIHRTLPVPGIRNVRIGPSFAKIPLDALLFLTAFWRLLAGRYDALDCHEEAGLMGVVLSRLFRLPTLYDMHSSLPEQLENFRYSGSKPLRWLFDVFERWTIRGSDAVIVICPYLKEVVSRVDADKRCFLIENSPLAESGATVSSEEAEGFRRELGLEGAFVLLYTGTFEAYQGLPLLYEAFQRVRARAEASHARLVMVGGHPEQIEEAKKSLAALDGALAADVVFTGQRPPAEMPRYLSLADALVSPRSLGKNTPLKIYSYLRSGKPIVATRLLTHTQVLDDTCAVLTEPTPERFAEGILELVSDPERARAVALAARARSEEEYSYERYVERTRRVLDFLSERVGGAPAQERAATLE